MVKANFDRYRESKAERITKNSPSKRISRLSTMLWQNPGLRARWALYARTGRSLTAFPKSDRRRSVQLSAYEKEI